MPQGIVEVGSRATSIGGSISHCLFVAFQHSASTLGTMAQQWSEVGCHRESTLTLQGRPPERLAEPGARDHDSRSAGLDDPLCGSLAECVERVCEVLFAVC